MAWYQPIFHLSAPSPNSFVDPFIGLNHCPIILPETRDAVHTHVRFTYLHPGKNSSSLREYLMVHPN